MKPYIVSTPGIKLVPTQIEHQELLGELEVCPELVCGNKSTSVLSGKPLAEYLEKCQKIWENSGAVWTIIVDGESNHANSSQEEIGVVSLEKLSDSYELNYWIKAKLAIPTGINALKLVLLEATQELKASRIVWHGEVGNWLAWQLVWENGFIREGIRRGVDESKQYWQASLLHEDPLKPASAWDGPALESISGSTSSEPETDASASTGIITADSRDPEALVKQFHQVYGLPIIRSEAKVDIERIHMRMSLILEETAELVGAVYGGEAREELEKTIAKLSDNHNRDVVETADALADLVYVTYGMALECGISLPDVLAEVQASNLSKLGADGKPIYREDGKVLKGPGFFPPNVKRALQKRISD